MIIFTLSGLSAGGETLRVAPHWGMQDLKRIYLVLGHSCYSPASEPVWAEKLCTAFPSSRCSAWLQAQSNRFEPGLRPLKPEVKLSCKIDFFLNKCFITATDTDENIDIDVMSKLHGWKRYGEPAKWYTPVIPTFRILTLKQARLHNVIQTKTAPPPPTKKNRKYIYKEHELSKILWTMNISKFNPLVVLRISPMTTTGHKQLLQGSTRGGSASELTVLSNLFYFTLAVAGNYFLPLLCEPFYTRQETARQHA